MAATPLRTLGVEEEVLLVDPATGRLTAVASEAIRHHVQSERGGDAPVEPELFRQQLETMTRPTADLPELATMLRAGRRALCEAAEEAGAAAVAVATPVLVDRDTAITRQPRYERIRQECGELARTALVSAMHVHVSVADDEEGVRVLDGIAPWLPLLLAISSNSPYFRGRDTGHASWRSQVWSRWPTHGSGQPFGDVETYRRVTERLVAWGAGLDDAMVYFDARLSSAFPTVEVRVADVTTDVDDAVLVAALTRALVSAAAAEERTTPWRSELLRAATWRASRHGLADHLVDPLSGELVPSRDAIATLRRYVAGPLDAAGDSDLVDALVDQVLARGTGAVLQRRTFEEAGVLEAVVADVARRTRSEQGLTAP